MDAVEPSAKTRPADAPAPPDPSLAPHAPADADAPKRGWSRVKHLVVHNILHLDDTPHRIAWGVFWGFVVGATPTIGLQMIIYVAVATVVRANKVSGILPVWLSNPLTAVPLYYTNWMIGRFVMTGETTASEASK